MAEGGAEVEAAAQEVAPSAAVGVGVHKLSGRPLVQGTSTLCRVIQQVSDLCSVDFDMPPLTLPILPIFHHSKQNQAGKGSAKITVNPIQVRDLLNRPVQGGPCILLTWKC